MMEFEVSYRMNVSTWRNDWERSGRKIMSLESKPIGEERRQLEKKMEEDYINLFRKHRQNLADVSYKITRIRAVPKPTSRKV